MLGQTGSVYTSSMLLSGKVFITSRQSPRKMCDERQAHVDLLAEITSKRNYNDWLLEISSGTAVQFEERSSLCAWVKVALTTKLTTYWLDVLGRLWTMRRQKMRIRGQFGHLGRVWTARRVLQNRRLQVRFLSHLPRKIILGFSVSHPCNLKDTPCLQRRIPQI